jgi:SAM-dependent methyltransferase
MTSAAEAIIGIYQRHADAWDRDRDRSLVELPWLDSFAALLPAGGRVLDIGCGAGDPIARHFAAIGHRVTGIDTSPRMIALCRERLPQQDWRVADMRQLSLGVEFDGLLAWDSFFHLTQDEQRLMFPIFARHAAPGAALMFTSGPAGGEAIGSFQGEPLYHSSLDAAEYRELLADNGFAVVAHQAEDPDCGHHTIWLSQRR